MCCMQLSLLNLSSSNSIIIILLGSSTNISLLPLTSERSKRASSHSSVGQEKGLWAYCCSNNKNPGEMDFFIIISWPERIIIYLQPNILYPVWDQTESGGIYRVTVRSEINECSHHGMECNGM